MATMKPNTRLVYDYLKDHNTEDMTAEYIGKALGLEKRQVDGIFTSAFQRKGYGERILAEVENEDGTHTKVKFLKLTAEGMAYDPDAEE